MTSIDRFLEAVASGDGIPADLYTDTAVLDATVPGWRLGATGGEAISATYSSWFASPGRFEELERRAVTDGEVVRYYLTWEEAGVPHAAHHCHLLSVDGAGHITGDTVFCGGRWDAALLAQMAEAG